MPDTPGTPWSGMEPTHEGMDSWFAQTFPDGKGFGEFVGVNYQDGGQAWSDWLLLDESAKQDFIWDYEKAHGRPPPPWDRSKQERTWQRSDPEPPDGDTPADDGPIEWKIPDPGVTVTLPDGSVVVEGDDTPELRDRNRTPQGKVPRDVEPMEPDTTPGDKPRKPLIPWTNPVWLILIIVVIIAVIGGVGLLVASGSDDDPEVSTTGVEADPAPAGDEDAPSEDAEPCGVGCDREGDSGGTGAGGSSDPDAAAATDIVSVSHSSSDPATNTFVIKVAGDGQAYAEAADVQWYIVDVKAQGPDGEWTASLTFDAEGVDDRRGVQRTLPDSADGLPQSEGVAGATQSAVWTAPDTLEVTVTSASAPLAVETFDASLVLRLADDQDFDDDARGQAG